MYFDHVAGGTEKRSVYADDSMRKQVKVPDFRIVDFIQFANVMSEKRAQFLSLVQENEMREYLVDSWQAVTGVKLDQAQLAYAKR